MTTWYVCRWFRGLDCTEDRSSGEVYYIRSPPKTLIQYVHKMVQTSWKGDRQVPTTPTALKIADVLQIQSHDLMNFMRLFDNLERVEQFKTQYQKHHANDAEELKRCGFFKKSKQMS